MERQQVTMDAYMETGASVVASSLAPQLGSDMRDVARGQIDMRRLTVIENKDIGVLLYCKIRGRKSRVWEELYESLINLKVSIGGRGRRDIIRMEAVSRGGPAAVESEIQRPGWFSRNVLDRDWRQQQAEERT